MTIISELLADLTRRSVELWFEGDTLRFRAPKGALREDDRALLMGQKTEVLRQLKQRALDQIETFPLAYSQRALWFIHQTAPESAAYHVAFSARICSEVDMEAFGQAVQALVDRHSSLRTTYAALDGGLVQQVHGYMECPLQVRQAKGADIGELKELVVNAYREPFDLQKGPLLRAHIFVRGEKDCVLLLTAHHIACDGWSFLLLLDELRVLYAANKAQTAPALPRPKSEFVSYVEWQRQLTGSETGEKFFSYWQNKLSGELPVLNFPTDKPRPPTQTFNGSTHPFTIDADLTERLKSLARDQGSTLFTVLLAAFHVLLHRCTGQEDIIVGTPTYGRNRSEFSNLVGDLINTVALRGDLSGNPTFTDFLAQMRHVALEALEHQDYPFPLLVERLRLARDLSRSPIYQSLFVFQKFGLASDLEKFLTSSNASRIDFGGIELEPFFIPQQEGQLELVLEMGESGNQLFGNFKYNTDLFEVVTIERMATQFIKLLEGITMNPESRLSALVASIESKSGQQTGLNEFLSQLKTLGLRFRAEEGRLRIDAPKGILSPTLREKIINRKSEILQALLDSSDKQNDDVMPLQKVSRDGSLCLSFSQERLWFLYQLEPENISYNIPICLRMEGQLRVDVLKESLSGIIHRHETLRTTFAEVGGQPIQIVSPPSPINLFVVDLQGVSVNERREKARLVVIQEMQRSFDLRKGPLIRVALLQLSSEEHLLVVTMHHIIADGWSLGVFAREFEALYRSLEKGQASALPELPIQYADFAYCHRLWMQSRVLEPHLLYWKQKLSDIPVLQLPTDHPRPVVQRYRGAKKWFKLTRQVREVLSEFSQSHGVTLFMTLLAAFKALLYGYTGQTDFAVGTPVANRNRSELEGLIGFFVNTMVLRTDLSGDPRFVELLGKVKETTLEALTHQDAPFEKVVEAVNPSRDMSYSPLFQVMFAFQNFPWSYVNIAGLTINPELIDAGTSMLDLSLYMWEEEKGLSGSIEYNSDIFDDSTIERMVGHFEVLLGSALANPEKRLSELALLTPSERYQLLVTWNHTDADYPRDQCFQRLFEEQVERTPGAIAVICAGESLSYGELNSRANQVAYYLRGLGAQPDSIVGIYVDRSINMAVGLLGILKAGSSYTPLDPGFPKDRIEFMLKDSNAGILITQKGLSNNIEEFSGERISIDSDWDKISRESTNNLALISGPEHLAYVIYTSGSTGKPKGVQIPHKALVNFLYSMMREPGMTAADTVLSVTTMSFDIFGLELYLPLLSGARVVIAEREDTLDGSRLASLINEHNVTVMQATPSTWRLMIEAGWSGNQSLKVICGGEAFPKDLVGPLMERCKELWNLYGPTETTIWSTAYRVKSPDDPILIGLPIANTQTYILDKQLQPLPVGIVGELHIGGDGLSRGYLNRPELTAEKFIAHPFNEDPKARIYKTGDLARYRSDGMIECLGRIDHQVKLRGFRIELGEIEARIKDVDSVRNCVVVVREDHPGDQRLVAYYVDREGQGVSHSDLIKYLHTKLPDYMVPQQFEKLQAIPLTPNGKVDRKALPKPNFEIEAQRNYVPPQTESEIAISAIWKQVLKIEKPSIHDNFFELGGHSLLMAQVFSKVKGIGATNVPMIALFQYPTIASFSKYLVGRQTDRSSLQQASDRAKMKEENIMRQKELRKGRGAANA
jgi:amino acid adenylation domain-containing protein